MKKNRNYLFFITPGFVVYTIFAIIPVIYVVYLAFTNYTGMGKADFVGFENFIRIFNDQRFTPAFFNALKNNLTYLLCVWFIITPFQYFLAYFFFIKIPAYKYIKFMVFLPYVISSTVIGFFATLLFNPNIGLMNTILKSLGMAQSAWFGNPSIAFKLLVLVIMWQGAGSGIMIFYANFMDIPQEIMEACRVDGCTEWQRFTRILLPLSLPSCASIIMMSTIWALGVFDLPYILGGLNGGVGGSLDFASMVFYRYTFGSGLDAKTNLGFGSAISVVMFLFMLVVTFLQNKVLNKFEYEN